METVQYIPVPPDNVVAVLEQFSTSKEGINKFSQLVIDEVKEGREDALKVALFMKTIKEIAEGVNKELADDYLKEASKYGEKSFSHLGAEISVAPVYTAYDYEACNDPVWNDLMRIVINAGEQMKEREKFLRALPGSTTIVIENTGEAVTIVPPVKKQREGIKISIR